MMKIFRPDLKLSNKWWHRLVKVLWILSIIIVIVGVSNFFTSFNNTYDYVDMLKYRLQDNGYSTANELLYTTKEYISYTCNDYPITHVLTYDDYDNLKGMFCSNRWSVQNLEEISKKTNLEYESYDSSLSNLSVRSVDDVMRKGNPELCIVKTDYGHSYLRFQGVFGDNLCIVKKNNSILLLIECMLLVGLYTLVTIIIYYKVIIYIIYGSSKNSHKK